jgi:hypothetical protein
MAAMEAFVRVVEAGSFFSSEKQLRIGQPAVSKTIAQLAKDLSGSRPRHGRVSSASTDAGRAALPAARWTSKRGLTDVQIPCGGGERPSLQDTNKGFRDTQAIHAGAPGNDVLDFARNSKVALNST